MSAALTCGLACVGLPLMAAWSAQDAVINPQDLEETYTQGFKRAIEKGGAGGIMCALAKSPLPGLSAALANP